MQIRKFVIAVVSTFDDRGNKAASKSMDALIKQSAELTKQYNALTRAQLAAASSAKTLADGADDADDELARLQARISKLDDKIEDLNSTIGKSRKRLDALGKRSLKDVGDSFQGASDRLGKFKTALAPVGEVAATAARGLAVIGTAAVGVGIGVIKMGTEFESLRARLKTVEGSVEGASRAFATIQKFAATTPFEIDNLTQGFTQLRVRGVKPTTDVLTGLGDLTSAFGLTFTDVTDAIGAAARGELDPIEKFGISAKIAGDQIKLSFKGQTVEVNRSADAVTNALVQFGKMDGVQGAMADQSATAAGMISNLKDAVSTFLDEVAQLGVLDEFKGLLGDLSNAAGGQGFAGIIADALVVGLKALRQILSEVTEEDIKGFLIAAVDLAKAFADAVGLVTAALEVFTIASGDSSDALANMTLAVLGLVAAFTGPAGLAIAAAAVGVVMGRMLANVITDMQAVSGVVAALDNRITVLTKNIADRQKRIAAIEARAAGRTAAREAKEDAFAKKRGARLERVAGGAGEGLRKELTAEDAGFQAQFVELGDEESKAAAREKLFTTEGLAVAKAIDVAESKKVEQVERKARREARRAGKTSAQIDKAAQSARQSATAASRSNRRKAFEAAEKTLGETGSAEAAATAASRQVAGRGKKGGLGGKGKADTFFDFEDQVKKAARSQAETFAAQELERLKAEGVATRDAIEQSREAGRKRAELLSQKFLEAGKIFEPGKEDNILDILGLKGAGSVLEGRPAPENLVINSVFTFNAIAGDFNQTVTVEGPGAVEDATSLASQTIVEQAFVPNMQTIIDLIDQQQRLQADRRISAAGGGTSTQGPPG